MGGSIGVGEVGGEGVVKELKKKKRKSFDMLRALVGQGPPVNLPTPVRPLTGCPHKLASAGCFMTRSGGSADGEPKRPAAS